MIVIDAHQGSMTSTVMSPLVLQCQLWIPSNLAGLMSNYMTSGYSRDINPPLYHWSHFAKTAATLAYWIYSCRTFPLCLFEEWKDIQILIFYCVLYNTLNEWNYFIGRTCYFIILIRMNVFNSGKFYNAVMYSSIYLFNYDFNMWLILWTCTYS